MSRKKYLSLDGLSDFLANLNSKFAPIIHKHEISDITDYIVEEELSPTSNNPVASNVLDAKFNTISDIMETLASETFVTENIEKNKSELEEKINSLATGTFVINAKDVIYDNSSSNIQANNVKEAIDELSKNTCEHFDSTIYSENGAHGLRFNKYEFELFQDGEWIKLPTPEPMTLAIDLTNSNPNTCCTYEGGAISMTAKSDDWDKFFGHYPVLMKDGKEVVRLDPNDFTKDLDGNPVDITSGETGDVMIAFPRKGLKITTSNNVLRISFIDATNNEDYKYYAHQYNDRQLDKFYMGAYEGFLDGNGALRSLSGKEPTVNISIQQARTAARANGSNYEQIAFYQLLYLQCMFLMKYKSLDSQTALGMGRVSYDDNYEINEDKKGGTTGEMNAMGLDYGTSTGLEGVKFAGIEHFWGSLYTWVDGCQTNNSYNYQFTTKTFGSTNTNDYTTVTTSFNQNQSGYLTKPIGTTEGGFLLGTGGGSSTTYFCDIQYCQASRIANYGNSWNGNLLAGAFCFSFYDTSTTAKEFVGTRLMKL